MLWIILILIIGGLVIGPTLWIQSVMSRHAADRPDFPGTGGELARHLLDSAGLQSVTVESGADGDHYDPTDKVVRLTTKNHDGRSLTAVAVGCA